MDLKSGSNHNIYHFKALSMKNMNLILTSKCYGAIPMHIIMHNLLTKNWNELNFEKITLLSFNCFHKKMLQESLTISLTVSKSNATFRPNITKCAYFGQMEFHTVFDLTEHWQNFDLVLANLGERVKIKRVQTPFHTVMTTKRSGWNTGVHVEIRG